MNKSILRTSSLFALAVGFAVTLSNVSAQTNYTWSKTSVGAADWNASTANWTPSTGIPGALDNIVGNSSGSANLTLGAASSYAINNFTITNPGSSTTWSVFTTAAASLAINGTLTQGAGLTTAIRSGAGFPLALTVGQVNVNGDLSLGSVTLTQGLGSLSVTTGTTVGAGGVLNLNVAGDYGLGLLTTSGATAGTVNLVQSSSGAQSRTVTVSGLASSGAGVSTIQTAATGATTTNTATLNINGSTSQSSNAILSNGVGGALSLTKNGSGTQTLTGTSTYTGATTISGGTLSVSTLANGGLASNIGASTGVASNLILSGGTLSFTGAATTITRLFSVGTSGGTLDGSGTGALNINNAGAMGFNGESGARTLTLSGSAPVGTVNTVRVLIADNGGATSVVKNGSTTWSLNGVASTYTGGTTINGGSIRGTAEASLGATSGALTINNGFFQAVANYTDSRQVRLGNINAGVAAGSGFTFEWSGNVVNDGLNAGGLTKTGAGVVKMSGNNTYTLGTTVSNGTLLINNTSGSGVGTGNVQVAVTAASTVFGGSGTVTLAANNSVTFANGTVANTSTLSVGNGVATSPETFTINTSGTGSLVLGDFTKVTLDLWTNSLSGADLLVTSGAVSFGTNVSLNLLNTGGLTFSSGDQFNLFDWGTTPTGTFTAFVLPTLAGGLSWDTSALYTTGIISVTSVPEPSSTMLLGLGLFVVLAFRRRVRVA